MIKQRTGRASLGRVPYAYIITVSFLIVLLIVKYLVWDGLLDLPVRVNSALNFMIQLLGVWLIISVFLKLTKRSFQKLFHEPEERIFFSKIYSWSLYTIGVLYILSQLGVSLGNITLVIGLLATGLAFAIREILLSVFGWLILLRKRPFRIGDYIKIDGREGRVLHIGTFYVRIDMSEKRGEDFTQIPNRFFLEKSIDVLGKSTILDTIEFPLAYVPANFSELTQKFQQDILKLAKSKEYLKTYLDVKDNKLLLVVEVELDFDSRFELRSRIVEHINGLLGEAASFSK
jgi:small-conductance mechanosensitive channel